MNKTAKRLYKVLRKMHIDREEMELNSNFHTDYLFDKTDMEILYFYLESSFNISINAKDEKKLSTISTTFNYLEEQLIKKKPILA